MLHVLTWVDNKTERSKIETDQDMIHTDRIMRSQKEVWIMGHDIRGCFLCDSVVECWTHNPKVEGFILSTTTLICRIVFLGND